MSSCEKCWADAGGDADRYHELLLERWGDKACTPEERAGPNASRCPHCRRLTIHQHTKEPMCDCFDAVQAEAMVRYMLDGLPK